jgi:hypothetical protein
MFTITPIASPIHGKESLERLAKAYRPAFESIGGRFDASEGPTLPFVMTGGTEAQILEQWDASEPLFLVAHPDQNSLPSSLEALARVGQLGGKGRILYLSGPDDRDGLNEIASAVHDLSVYRQMSRQTIGVVGPPSDWLVASMPEPDVLKAARAMGNAVADATGLPVEYQDERFTTVFTSADLIDVETTALKIPTVSRASTSTGSRCWETRARRLPTSDRSPSRIAGASSPV